MKTNSRIEASLVAAQQDVSRIFQGYEVPQEYRTRLTAYIQCWYLDQAECSAEACTLRHPAAASGQAMEA